MSDEIILPKRLDLASTPDLVTTLLAKSADADISLNAKNLTHFGALGLQTVISAAARSNASGGTLRLVNISDRVLTQLNNMGITPEQIMEVGR